MKIGAASCARGLRKSSLSVARDSGGMVRASSIGNVSAPPRLEKALEKPRAFLHQNAGSNFAVVIERRHLEQIHDAASGTAARIGTTENDAAHPNVDQGAGAHRAGFLGDVKVAIVQAPVAH